MNRIFKSLIIAGTAAVALAGTAARADQPFYSHDTAPVAQAIPSAPLPEVAFRRAGWRDREYEREAFRHLEHERAEFYAHWNGNPWARRRFERHYAEQVQELRERFSAPRYRHEGWRG